MHIPVINKIKEDFNWVFSSNLEEDELFKRLSYLANQSETKVIIFIDAIDEIPYRDRKFDLNNLCKKINLFKNIKLCISCKQNEWEEFLKVRDISTRIKESLYQVGFDEEEPWYKLGYFSNRELEALDKSYKDVFNYKGNIKGELKKDCKLGFMLRVVSEVYSGRRLPDKVNDIDLLKKYLNKKINKMSNKSSKIAKSVLKELGKCIIEEESEENSFSGKVDENRLKEKLGLSVLDQIPRELFSFNILTRDELDSGVVVVGFYYERLRDFIISVLSFKLPHKTGDDFKEIILKMIKGSAGKDALKWYIPNAKLSQRDLMLECKKRQAKTLLDSYIEMIDSNFPNIKDKFEPKTFGEIGIAISDYKSPFVDGYGFREINQEEEVIVVERGENGRNFFKHGVNLVVGSSDYLNPDLQAKKSIVDQLKKIMKSGLLEEKNNINLLIEKTLGILYYHGKELGIAKPNDHFLPRYNEILPVDFNDIIEKIKLFNAKKYYKEEQLKELIDSGMIEVKKNGEHTLMSYNESIFDYETINKKASRAVRNDKEIPFPNISGDFPPFILLYDYIKKLKSKGIHYLDRYILPEPDIELDKIHNKIIENNGSQSYIPDIIIAQYSNKQLKKYIKKFFQIFINEYNNLVETCFPNLKNNMILYKSQPVNFFIKCSQFNLKNSWSLCYGYEKSDEKENKFEVSLDIESDKEFNYCSGIETLFRVTGPRNFSSRFNIKKVNEFSVLRDWVYNKIENEINQLLEINEFDILMKK